jgi:RNA polymerase sigma factor (TIGR02999 family)
MRRILIDRARAKQAAKRGGNFVRGDFFESQIEAPIKEDKILAVDEALGELETVDPELAKLVKLRYFAGMSWPEISQATGIPDRTLRRRWTYAKAWLKERIERSA